jgi:hypothetical protein
MQVAISRPKNLRDVLTRTALTVPEELCLDTIITQQKNNKTKSTHTKTHKSPHQTINTTRNLLPLQWAKPNPHNRSHSNNKNGYIGYCLRLSTKGIQTSLINPMTTNYNPMKSDQMRLYRKLQSFF